MTELFGEALPPMSVPDLAPDDDDDREQTKTRRATYLPATTIDNINNCKHSVSHTVTI